MRSFAVGILLVAAVALTSSAVAAIQEKVEAAKASGKPVVVTLQKGEYTCTSCEPPVTVKADGALHKVQGNPEYDQIGVFTSSKNPSELTVVEYLNEKRQAVYHYTVSGDGKTLTVKWQDYSGAKGKAGGYTAKRVGAAPAGAHAASGSWQIEQTMETTSFNK